MKDFFIGLDIGGTKCAVLLAKQTGGIRIIDKTRFETNAASGFDDVYVHICQAITEIVERNSLTFANIRAIGVSCGGPLDSKRGLILSPPNLPGWDEIPLTKLLEDAFNVPAFIQNDANACALVEWKLGAGRGCRNMIFLTMGTGMGAGVIAEGQLLVGNNDMGGEVGHLRLAEDGPVGFGKAGSFEGYTSGGGIGRQAVELTDRLIKQGKTPAWIKDGHGTDEISAKLMADYAKKGDSDALAFWGHIGKMLGRGLSLLVDAFNPECIVIGSIFVRCEELLRPEMEKELRKEAIVHSLRGLRVVPAQTGEQLGDLASIMVALNALNIDIEPMCDKQDERALAHYEHLFKRYPALECCRESIMQAYLMLVSCYRNNGKILLCGNGGSCADCEHIAGELMKGFLLKRPLPDMEKDAISKAVSSLMPGAEDLLAQGLPAICLTGHSALSTAVQNDMAAELSFAQQTVALGKPGDVLIGISTSGNSKNVALAVAVAQAKGLKTIGLTGGTGGKLAEACDCAIVVPAKATPEVQEFHLPIYHALCAMLEAHFFAE